MKAKARLEKSERAAEARTRTQARTFVYFTDATGQPAGGGEISGTVDGEKMTLAEWLKVKRPRDQELHIRFVDDVTPDGDGANVR
jgi:hypothetical protein